MMSYPQRVFENFDNYDELDDYYDDGTEFANALASFLSSYNLNYLTSSSTELTNIKAFITIFAYPIYEQYKTDRIAYLDINTFINRIVNAVSYKVGKWYLKHKIDADLLNSPTLQKFIANGGTTSHTGEVGKTGSAVIQKSASTPTGITHDTDGEEIEMSLSKDDDVDVLSVDDGYEDKYTNFVGKTNGLHKNEVDRDTSITRTSNYGLAQEILDKIPYSYISEVLGEVSQHFIQVY